MGGLLPQDITAHQHTGNPLQAEQQPQTGRHKPPGQAEQQRRQMQQQVAPAPLGERAENPQRKRHEQRAKAGIEQKGIQQQMQQRMQPQPHAADNQPGLAPPLAHAGDSNIYGMNSE